MTESTVEINTASTREILRRLELEVTRRLDGLLQGENRGLTQGHGTELGETRRYEPGDDVRRIDWNVSARLPETYIRQTIAERELQTWLIVDRSARLNFGTQSHQKRELILAAAAAIGHLTSRDGNRIGAILTEGESTETIEPGGSRKHLLRILHQIHETTSEDGSGPTNLASALTRCAATTKRRGLVAVLSDFQVEPGWERPLAILQRQHDVVAIQVTDPREFELPNVGLITVRDPATGAERDIATHKASVREAFRNKAQARQDRLVATLNGLGVAHAQLSTDRPWLADMVNFVLSRKHLLNRQVRNR